MAKRFLRFGVKFSGSAKFRGVTFVVVTTALGCGSDRPLPSMVASDRRQASLSQDDYHPREREQVNRVVDDHGPLYIRLNQPSEPRVEWEVARPWSGYWYPFRKKELFSGASSPLAKLDRALLSQGSSANIAERERETFADLELESWEGHCDGWARASIAQREPIHAKTINGVFFSVSDIEAIYTRLYQGVSWVRYGVSYRGDFSSDGTYQDLRPEAFHNLVRSQLSLARRPLLIDDDAGIEVWTKPMFRFRYVVEEDPDLEDAFRVKAYGWIVEERNEASDRLTSEKDVVRLIYHYRLFVDRSDETDDGYRVIAGEWLEKSRRSHPDTVEIMQPNGPWSDGNEQLSEHASTIFEMFEITPTHFEE